MVTLRNGAHKPSFVGGRSRARLLARAGSGLVEPRGIFMNAATKCSALILDVDPHRGAMLAEMLAALGYAPVRVQGVGAAIAVCSRVPFAIVVLGELAEDQDRAAACRAVRNMSQSPILAIVADDTPATIEPLLDAGASDVVPGKPLDPSVMRLRVAVALRRGAVMGHAEAMLRAMPDLVFRMNGAAEFLAFHASNTHELYAPPTDIVGRRASDLLPPDVAEGTARAVRRALATGELQVHEYALDLPSGRSHFEARIVMSGPDEVLALVRNITASRNEKKVRAEVDSLAAANQSLAAEIAERRRAEDALRAAHAEQTQMQERLLTLQKLDSLGLMAGGVAHDFNNLLAAILGNAQVALLRLGEDQRAREPIERVVVAGKRAAELTQQLLAYSGRGPFQVCPVDLSQHVSEIALVLEATLPKTAHLVLDLAPSLPSVLADVAQLQQVVMNLLINASEAIPERGGTVYVSTGLARPADRHARTTDDRSALWMDPGNELKPDVEYVFLEVRDDGCGMDPGTSVKAFDPFFTTKATGRGLGLAAVLGVVRTHKGGIFIESALDRGTTFSVYFPVAGAPTTTPRARSLPPAGSGTVLVVDDEEMLRRVTIEILQQLGYRALGASNGTDALALVRSHASELVTVILDMTMPGPSGDVTFREIQKITPGLPVVLTSGYHVTDAMARFGAEGLAGFLQKPYTVEQLARAVEEALSGIRDRDSV